MLMLICNIVMILLLMVFSSDLGADADDSIMLISVCTDSCRGGVVKDPG